ncbi:MAG: DUF1501 domain-containing protein [Chloroflexi bacterium]|nr:DUF1501 domain-containing protein [Chloroflexota bacterium]
MAFTRRDFLRRGTLFVAMGLTAPTFLTRTVEAMPEFGSSAAANSRKMLVVVQLGGGNDGLNTVVPFGDDAYYQVRPTLGVPRADVLRLTDTIGLHPSLAKLKDRHDAGQLAIVQGVGYPNPNRSHFRSMEIWQTAIPDKVASNGWIGHYLDAQCCGEGAPGVLPAANIGGQAPLALWNEHVLVPSIGSLSTFQFRTEDGEAPDPATSQLETFRRIYAQQTSERVYDEFVRKVGVDAVNTSETLKRVARSYQTTVQYPRNGFGQGLQTIAQIISGDLGSRVFYISTGGFDTHANQARTHANLLTNVSDGLHAFMLDIERLGKLDEVMVMCFSEFGRRVRENGSGGTDHGTAAPVLLLGGQVQRGLHGQQPSLADLDSGDLKYNVDFRAIYAGLVKDWLGGDPSKVVDPSITPLSLIRTASVAPTGLDPIASQGTSRRDLIGGLLARAIA